MLDDWTPERRARLEALIETHDEMARRFAGYHKTAVSRGDYTVWDGRSEEEAQITMSVRAALAEIDRLAARIAALAEERGRLAGALEQKQAELQIMLNMSLTWRKFCDPHGPFDTLALLTENATMRYELEQIAARSALNPTQSEKSE